MSHSKTYILGIESSCDETSAAVVCNNHVLSNIIANQSVHEMYGGVVPELASRAHQKNIIPTVDAALKKANVTKEQLHAVAFTNGPGLIGSLMVGTSFAKAFALALNIPIIEVNHMQAHVLAHFADDSSPSPFSGREGGRQPAFPFLCMTVSGGHTQIIHVRDFFDMEIIGQTTDDAAGEAFDKIAKIIGLSYPGGPLIDKYATEGNPLAFKFPHPKVDKYDFSFSGLKTSVLNFIKREKQNNIHFVEEQLKNICASVQHTIVSILMKKLLLAAEETGITNIAVAGGVSANSGLRKALLALEEKQAYKIFIPPFEYCTDNAAMIAVTGYYKYLRKYFAPQSIAPVARFAGF